MRFQRGQLNRIPWKHAIKVGLAAALLAALCWQSDLTNIEYPVMGLVATMLSANVSETVKAGWGRLGGSVIGGVCAATCISLLGLNPLTGFLAYGLAVMACETLHFPTMQNQAGIVAVLITSIHELGKHPWLYTFNRVFDNGIGVIIGILVTILLWPERPRDSLKQEVLQTLDELQQSFEILARRLQPYQDQPQTQAALQETIEDQQFRNISDRLRKADALLDKSIYGVAGWQLAKENWSLRLTALRRLRRHLRSLNRLMNLMQTRIFMALCQPHLGNLGEQLLEQFRYVSQAIANPAVKPPPVPVSIEVVSQHISDLRHQQKRPRNYGLEEVVHTYELVNVLGRVHRDLTLLEQAFEPITIIESELPPHVAPPPPKPLSLGHLPIKAIPQSRLKHIFKTALAIGLTLAVIEAAHLSYGYYATLAVAICLQSTLGNSIQSAWGRTIGTFIGAVLAAGLIYTLGATPLSVGLGMMLLIVIMNLIGLPQGHKPGAFLLALSIMVYSDQAGIYVWSRFWETELGIAIALLVGILVWPDTSAHHLDQEIKANFERLGSLYQKMLQQYHSEPVPSQLKALIQETRGSYRQQLQLLQLTDLEPVQSLGVASLRRFWNIYVDYQFAFISSILSFEAPESPPASASLATTSTPDHAMDQILTAMEPELSELVHLGSQSLSRSSHTPPDAHALATRLHDLEEKLRYLRSQTFFRTYELDIVLDVFSILGIIEEITENLIQFAQELGEPTEPIALNASVEPR